MERSHDSMNSARVVKQGEDGILLNFLFIYLFIFKSAVAGILLCHSLQANPGG